MPTQIIGWWKTCHQLNVKDIENTGCIGSSCIRNTWSWSKQAKQHACQLRHDKSLDSGHSWHVHENKINNSLVIQGRRFLTLQEGTALFAQETVVSSDQDCWWLFGGPCQE